MSRRAPEGKREGDMNDADAVPPPTTELKYLSFGSGFA
jgi:hypothetical protein